MHWGGSYTELYTYENSSNDTFKMSTFHPM